MIRFKSSRTLGRVASSSFAGMITLNFICARSPNSVYGYPLHSGRSPGRGVVGQTPWSVRGALVRPPEGGCRGLRAGEGARLPRDSNCTGLSKADSPFLFYAFAPTRV